MHIVHYNVQQELDQIRKQFFYLIWKFNSTKQRHWYRLLICYIYHSTDLALNLTGSTYLGFLVTSVKLFPGLLGEHESCFFKGLLTNFSLLFRAGESELELLGFDRSILVGKSSGFGAYETLEALWDLLCSTITFNLEAVKSHIWHL